MPDGSNKPKRRRPPGAKRPATEWQLTDAKARFSELFDRAQLTPQRVSRHGKQAVVVLSAREYHRMTAARHGAGTLVDFLAALDFADLDLERSPFDRDIDL